MSRYDSMYMDMAKIVAKYSTSNKLKVGSLIVRDSHVLSTGFNGTPNGYSTNECEDSNGKTLDVVIHSEVNAILKAAKNGIALSGSTLYVTHSPCAACASLIVQCGITKVVYNTLYEPKGVRGLAVLQSFNTIDVFHLPSGNQ